MVAFVFNEAPVTDVYFCLRPGYEELANELVDYAEEVMPNFNHMRQFVVFETQKVLTKVLAERKYQMVYESLELIIDFSEKELNYNLPAGFHFVNPL